MFSIELISPGLPSSVVIVGDATQVRDPLEIFCVCNSVGAKHGVGRTDIVENRFVGLKVCITFVRSYSFPCIFFSLHFINIKKKQRNVDCIIFFVISMIQITSDTSFRFFLMPIRLNYIFIIKSYTYYLTLIAFVPNSYFENVLI